jgi:hypothetical protein
VCARSWLLVAAGRKGPASEPGEGRQHRTHGLAPGLFAGPQGACTLLVPGKTYDFEEGTTFEFFATCPVVDQPLPSCPANQYPRLDNPQQVFTCVGLCVRMFLAA